jgi:hypothetical protein
VFGSRSQYEGAQTVAPLKKSRPHHLIITSSTDSPTDKAGFSRHRWIVRHTSLDRSPYISGSFVKHRSDPFPLFGSVHEFASLSRSFSLLCLLYTDETIYWFKALVVLGLNLIAAAERRMVNDGPVTPIDEQLDTVHTP